MSNDNFHPVSEIFPLMTGKAFDELCADIGLNGLREDIWRYEGKIVDGRNRQRACLHVGATPRYREWDGQGDLVKFVLSLNLHRRHLSESQRAMVAAKIANLDGAGNPRLNSKNPITPIGVIAVSQPQAAEMLNVSTQSVTRAKKVKDHGVPELVAAVERGDVSVAAAADVSEVEPEIQQRVVAGGTDAIMAQARQVRFENRRLQQATGNNESKGDGRKFLAGERVMALGKLIDELVELAGRPHHRYPFIQIKTKADELAEAYSRIVGASKRSA